MAPVAPTPAALPALLLLLPLALWAASGAAHALPATLLRDVRRAEQLRASQPGPLASAAGRPKRDLGVDPEKLLALLALWQQQQQLPQRSPLDAPLEAPLGAPIAAPLFRPAGRIPGYDLTDADDWELSMDNNELDSEDDGPVGAWLEAPPYAQARAAPPPFGAQRRAAFFLPALPPPPAAAAVPVALPGGGASKRETAWAGLAKEKRFMVSRKRQANPPAGEGGVRYLARLLAPPPRNPGIPLVRRVLL